jgi:hypothetical protein
MELTTIFDCPDLWDRKGIVVIDTALWENAEHFRQVIGEMYLRALPTHTAPDDTRLIVTCVSPEFDLYHNGSEMPYYTAIFEDTVEGGVRLLRFEKKQADVRELDKPLMLQEKVAKAMTPEGDELHEDNSATGKADTEVVQKPTEMRDAEGAPDMEVTPVDQSRGQDAR